MKARDLRPCDGCGGVLLRPGIGNFYVVRSSIALPDPRALRQLAGLTTFFGGLEGLAEVFVGSDVVKLLAEVPGGPGWCEALICFDCYTSKALAQVLEAAPGRRAAEEGEKHGA